jgi:hypothetical protein
MGATLDLTILSDVTVFILPHELLLFPRRVKPGAQGGKKGPFLALY